MTHTYCTLFSSGKITSPMGNGYATKYMVISSFGLARQRKYRKLGTEWEDHKRMIDKPANAMI